MFIILDKIIVEPASLYYFIEFCFCTLNLYNMNVTKAAEVIGNFLLIQIIYFLFIEKDIYQR